MCVCLRWCGWLSSLSNRMHEVVKVVVVVERVHEVVKVVVVVE